MKIASYQLQQHLQQKLQKFYILCGEDPFLLQESLSLLRQKAQTEGFDDRIRFDIESDSDIEQALHQAYTPPLFTGKKILELHWKTKITASAHSFLEKYGTQPSPYTLLVVLLSKLDSKTEQTKWFKAVEKNCVVVPLWPLMAKQLLPWIMARAKQHQLTFSSEAAQLLTHYSQGNLHAASQEIEKLSLCGSPSIDRTLIEFFVTDQGCFNAFDLMEQMLAGNHAQVQRILNYLKNEGTDPLAILGAFTYEVRNLAKMAREVGKGTPVAQVISQYRVRPTKQPAVQKFLQHKNYHDCCKLLQKAGKVDRIAKGAQSGDSWAALENTLLDLNPRFIMVLCTN
ncbi:MAG TPA: DNA polymerase III subunit delta [Gammaproteobacteria bacterium]|nr:DNA polymerase III subunit delta [Gammaproteobacteria bacterium]